MSRESEILKEISALQKQRVAILDRIKILTKELKREYEKRMEERGEKWKELAKTH